MGIIHLGNTCEQFKDESYYKYLEDQKAMDSLTLNAEHRERLEQRFQDYKKDPKFCIITPTPYLEKYASQSSMHLVLAHLVDIDDKYAEYYAGRNEYKLMDCSTFELGQSYAPEKLLELGHKCKADVIVLPDYPGQNGEKTIEAAIKHAPAIRAAGFKTMFVPQSEIGNRDGWIEAYRWAALDNDLIDVIGMSILGMPNAIPHINRAFARVVLTERLIAENEFNFKKAHHYLGLNAGIALEVPSLINMGVLTSCDSSGPVWCGILGHEYTYNSDSYLATKKPSKHVDFSYPFVKDPNVHRMIQRNIDMSLELFPK